MKVKAIGKQFIERNFVELVDYINMSLNKLTLNDNFSGTIRDVIIPSGETAQVGHSLGVTPKYRIILRQVGDALITDGDANTWTDKFIYLRNNGLNDVNLTVLIMRS